MRRIGTLFGAPPAATAGEPPLPRAAVIAPEPEAAPAPAEDLSVPFFEWLVDRGPALDTALQDGERRLLAQLDVTLGAADARSALLPRAPQIIPQLLNSLRDENQSTAALAARVTRDPHLVAEVIRMSNSAHYNRAGTPVTDLGAAIGRLGTEGLRRAIARVVLRPMFDGSADSLSARCSPRLWLHSDAKALACQQEAAARGLDPFEGYLAGLMHNIGWTAALRAVDRSAGGAPLQFSRAFVAAFEPRRESFFGCLVRPWQLTDGLTALGAELIDGELGDARSALGQALHAADRRATLEMLGGRADATAKH